MTTVAVIPARYGSTRFPGKPLAAETGKPLIQHVWEQVRRARTIDRVIIATDDPRIFDTVTSFGGEARMTNRDHPTGTDRVAEVAGALNLADLDIVLNVQGDEPEISPRLLDKLVVRIQQSTDGPSIGTLAVPFDDAGPKQGPGSPLDPNCVKVVLDDSGNAMYFSRSLIPYPRDTGGRVDRPSRWLLHLGVYGFRAEALQRIREGASSNNGLEARESLEQLRWLRAGYSIAIEIVDEITVGIDTPENYAAFVQRCREKDAKKERVENYK